MYKIVIFISSLFIIFFSFNLRSEVTVMSWGGKYQSVQKSTLGNTFTQQGGTEINWISWSDNPRLKIQDIIKKDTKNLSVDILDLLIGSRFSLNEIETNCKNGALYKFDLNKDLKSKSNSVPLNKDYLAPVLSDCLVGNILFSWNFAFNSPSFINSKPSSAEDFFDVEKFPGKRGLYYLPKTNIEFALMADGINEKGVYQVLQNQTGAINRAFKKIKNLCNHPKGGCVFWKSGNEPSELLKTGKVVMSTGWSNRFYENQINNNYNLQQVWNNQIIDYEFYAINNNSQKIDEALEFLKFISSPKIELSFLKEIPYSSWKKTNIIYYDEYFKSSNTDESKVYEFFPIKKNNFKYQLFINHKYWEQNFLNINKRWKKEIYK